MFRVIFYCVASLLAVLIIMPIFQYFFDEDVEFNIILYLISVLFFILCLAFIYFVLFRKRG